MGLLRIQMHGSFSGAGVRGYKDFSALTHGHADAVEKAIEYLEHDVLPKVINRDVALAKAGDLPEKGFGPTIKAALEEGDG